MSRPPAALTASDDKIRHLPLVAQAAFSRFQTSRAPADLDPVIFAILGDFVPRPPDEPMASLPGTTRLTDDLGFDSLAIAELIFFTEELFGIAISNEEILGTRTLDDLRLFLRRKIAASTAP